MQSHTPIHKTWSTDSITQNLPPGVKHPAIEFDRPRKHARRTSLPVRSHERHGKSNGTSRNAANISNPQAATERSKFRDSVLVHRSKKKAKQRTESMPSTSRSDTKFKPTFTLEEEADDGDEDSDPAYQYNTSSSLLGNIDSRDVSSAVEDSTAYAAEGSGYGSYRAVSSSSDASSSERPAFDWDTPRKSSIPATASHRSLHPPSGAQEETSTSNPANRSSLQLSGFQSSQQSTPKLKRAELDDHDVSRGEAIGTGQSAAGINSKSDAPLRSSVATVPAKNRRTHNTSSSTPSNPSIESLMLMSGSFLMVARLWQSDDELLHRNAVELLLLTSLSGIYYFLVRQPGETATFWSTDYRYFRTSGDDGAMCGLLLGPMVAVTALFASMKTIKGPRLASGDSLPFPPWRVESPEPCLGLRSTPHPHFSALTLSRVSLVSLLSMVGITILVHVLATKYARHPIWLRANSWTRFWSYLKFSTSITLCLSVIREICVLFSVPFWSGLTRTDVFFTATLFQSTLYVTSRLARRSFTLGELSLVASIGTLLSIETVKITSAHLSPATTEYVKTFRAPTPLLVFQLALVVGTFSIGFLLSPLLYLSRHLAQKPVHRLRWPHKRDLHRRLLAFFFYLFATLFVVGVLGLWTWWLLGKRNPWVWTLRFVIGGSSWWSRPLLITYWLSMIAVSIAGWQAVVLSGKRFRLRQGHPVSQGSINGASINHSMTASSSTSNSQNLARNQKGQGLISAKSTGDTFDGSTKTKANTTTDINKLQSSSTPLFPKKAAYLSLNARRKFFHALAVLLFAPGIAYDPAFMHLAFSLAFSVFIFAEYVRYYALYPFGAAVHVFLSEFTDHKDSGPVILSHFYLLTGCAAPLWVEIVSSIRYTPPPAPDPQPFWHFFKSNASAPAQIAPAVAGTVDISMFLGILTLGVADAVASVIGRRYGRLHWPSNGKTFEGSLAFVLSIFVGALFLRLIGWCAPFSLPQFALLAIILGIFEGISNQNDNLVLPVYAIVSLSILRM